MITHRMTESEKEIDELEKDYQELQKTNWKNIEYLNGKIQQLKKENESLKFQLSNIKTLDRRKIWELIERHKIRIVDDKGFVTAICNLALPEPVITSLITEADIIEVLNKWIDFKVTTSDDDKFEKSSKRLMFSKIAKEILGEGEGWEVVASGLVNDDIFEYEAEFTIGGKDIYDLLRDYDSKNIEIAIREVKDVNDT